MSWQHVVCFLCDCFQIVYFILGSSYLHLFFGDRAEAVLGNWYLFQNFVICPDCQQRPWTQCWCLEFTCRGQALNSAQLWYVKLLLFNFLCLQNRQCCLCLWYNGAYNCVYRMDGKKLLSCFTVGFVDDALLKPLFAEEPFDLKTLVAIYRIVMRLSKFFFSSQFTQILVKDSS